MPASLTETCYSSAPSRFCGGRNLLTMPSSQSMPVVLRKGILLSALFALCFSLVSCDLFGSDDDSSPEWVGQWEVEAFEDGTPDEPEYWNISEEEFKIVEDERAGQDEPCGLAAFEVVNQDGDVIELLGRTTNVEGETTELRLDVSGETMTATVLDASDEEESIGNEITLESVGEIPVPQDESTCDTV